MTTLAKIQITNKYITDLRSKIGYYIPWIPNEYADQATADNFYEVLRKDLEVARCVHLLSMLTSGLGLETKCEDPTLKKLSDYVLKQIKDFTHVRKSLVEKAILFGLGIQRKYYRKVKYMGQWWDMPFRFAEVDRRRLRIERDVDDKTNLWWTIWCPKIDQWIILEDHAINPAAPSGAAVQDYCWYVHTQEETSPYYEGLGDILYTTVYAKHKVIQYWSDLCESWSKPFLVAQLNLLKSVINSSMGTGFPTAQQRVDAMLETFEKCRANHIAVIDQDDKLQYYEHGSTGNNICKEFVNYCDSKIQLLILGSELTTTTGQGGDSSSYALGAVHMIPFSANLDYNQKRMDEALVEDILFDFYYRNQVPLRNLGIEFPNEGEVELDVVNQQPGQLGQDNPVQAGQGQVSAPTGGKLYDNKMS